MTTENMLSERRKYGINDTLKMTPKEEMVIIEYAKCSNKLKTQKAQGEHVVLVKCDPETYKLLKASGYNIYPNRKRGYETTYLCDLQHDVPHR